MLADGYAAGGAAGARAALERFWRRVSQAALLSPFRHGPIDVLLGRWGEGELWARMRVHRIATVAMNDLGYSSKLNAEWDFLRFLRDEGRRAANGFLRARARPRPSSTLDIDALLED